MLSYSSMWFCHAWIVFCSLTELVRPSMHLKTLPCITRLSLFHSLCSLCALPLPLRQRKRPRRRRNQRGVPLPQRDPRTPSQPSCSPTRTYLLHMLQQYVVYEWTNVEISTYVLNNYPTHMHKGLSNRFFFCHLSVCRHHENRQISSSTHLCML